MTVIETPAGYTVVEVVFPSSPLNLTLQRPKDEPNPLKAGAFVKALVSSSQGQQGQASRLGVMLGDAVIGANHVSMLHKSFREAIDAIKIASYPLRLRLLRPCQGGQAVTPSPLPPDERLDLPCIDDKSPSEQSDSVEQQPRQAAHENEDGGALHTTTDQAATVEASRITVVEDLSTSAPSEEQHMPADHACSMLQTEDSVNISTGESADQCASSQLSPPASNGEGTEIVKIMPIEQYAAPSDRAEAVSSPRNSLASEEQRAQRLSVVEVEEGTRASAEQQHLQNESQLGLQLDQFQLENSTGNAIAQPATILPPSRAEILNLKNKFVEESVKSGHVSAENQRASSSQPHQQHVSAPSPTDAGNGDASMTRSPSETLTQAGSFDLAGATVEPRLKQLDQAGYFDLAGPAREDLLRQVDRISFRGREDPATGTCRAHPVESLGSTVAHVDRGTTTAHPTSQNLPSSLHISLPQQLGPKLQTVNQTAPQLGQSMRGTKRGRASEQPVIRRHRRRKEQTETSRRSADKTPQHCLLLPAKHPAGNQASRLSEQDQLEGSANHNRSIDDLLVESGRYYARKFFKMDGSKSTADQLRSIYSQLHERAYSELKRLASHRSIVLRSVEALEDAAELARSSRNAELSYQNSKLLAYKEDYKRLEKYRMRTAHRVEKMKEGGSDSTDGGMSEEQRTEEKLLRDLTLSCTTVQIDAARRQVNREVMWGRLKRCLDSRLKAVRAEQNRIEAVMSNFLRYAQSAHAVAAQFDAGSERVVMSLEA